MRSNLAVPGVGRHLISLTNCNFSSTIFGVNLGNTFKSMHHDTFQDNLLRDGQDRSLKTSFDGVSQDCLETMYQSPLVQLAEYVIVVISPAGLYMYVSTIKKI